MKFTYKNPWMKDKPQALTAKQAVRYACQTPAGEYQPQLAADILVRLIETLVDRKQLTAEEVHYIINDDYITVEED